MAAERLAGLVPGLLHTGAREPGRRAHYRAGAGRRQEGPERPAAVDHHDLTGPQGRPPLTRNSVPATRITSPNRIAASIHGSPSWLRRISLRALPALGGR